MKENKRLKNRTFSEKKIRNIKPIQRIDRMQRHSSQSIKYCKPRRLGNRKRLLRRLMGG
jgi:hypothetical protein